MSEIKRPIGDRGRKHTLVCRESLALNLTKFRDSLRVIKIGSGGGDKLVRLSVVAILQPVLLPFRNHPVERLLIEHAAGVQAYFLLPTGECGSETAGRRFVLSIEGLVYQRIVKIPTALLFAAESPDQFVLQGSVTFPSRGKN